MQRVISFTVASVAAFDAAMPVIALPAGESMEPSAKVDGSIKRRSLRAKILRSGSAPAPVSETNRSVEGLRARTVMILLPSSTSHLAGSSAMAMTDFSVTVTGVDPATPPMLLKVHASTRVMD